MDLFGDLPEPKSHYTDEITTACLQIIDDTTATAEKQDKGDSPDNILDSGEKRKLDYEAGHVCNSLKRRKYAGYQLRGFVAERKGERDEMQDCHIVLDNFDGCFAALDPSIYRLSLYAVFDGHRGARASRYAAEHLPRNLQEKFPKGNISQVEKEIKKCFIEAYKKTDEEFLKDATKVKPPWKDGTTAISVLTVNDTLYVGNLGDSKAVLCRYNSDQGKAVGIPLSTDHSPSTYEERVRIQKAGGQVKDGRVMGVLEVSRSLGDGQYKTYGVSCLPDIKKCQLGQQDRFILIGCDGLWKSFTVQESIDFVEAILKEEIEEGEDKLPLSKEDKEDTKFGQACNRLASEAVLRLSADNVTVILIRISLSTSS